MHFPPGAPPSSHGDRRKIPYYFKQGKKKGNHFEIHRPRAFSIAKSSPLMDGLYLPELYLTWGKGSKITLAPSGLPVSNKGRKEREKKKRLRNVSEGPQSPGADI